MFDVRTYNFDFVYLSDQHYITSCDSSDNLYLFMIVMYNKYMVLFNVLMLI